MGFTLMFEPENKIEVLDSILKARQDKENAENTFHVSRANFEKSTNEQIEAWFTKFFEVIIDDSEKPYVVHYENKKQAAVYFGKIILKNLNKRNLDRTIGYINQATDQISKLGDGIKTDTSLLEPKKKTKTKKKYKPHPKETQGNFF